MNVGSQRPSEEDRQRFDVPHLLLDACTVINLYACRRMAEILEAEALPVAIVDAVQLESLYVFKVGKDTDPREREPVDLPPLIGAGLLKVITPTEPEIADFVDLTLHFKGDGEAMTIAVAVARGWPVVTDDRKAIRLIAGRTQVRSSLALVKGWPDRMGIDASDLRQVLQDLRYRGNYIPSANHPLRLWWDSILGNR